MGVANLSRWYVEAALREGWLQEIVLEDAQPDPLAIWAVYPTARMVPPKVRRFIEALERHLALGNA